MDNVEDITIDIGNDDDRDGEEKNNLRNIDTASPPSENDKIPTFQTANIRIAQNFLIVWLDKIFNEVDHADCIDSITQLREIVNTVQIFSNIDQCIDFISSIEDEKIFIISSEEFGQTIVPIVHDMSQIHSIYVSSEQTIQDEEWIDEWSKIKGIFNSITLICEELKLAVDVCDQNSVRVSFIKSADRFANKSLDELDQSFMCIQILKEILPEIDFDQSHFKDFIKYCREEIFVNNDAELYNVDKLEQEYHRRDPIWWYTSNSFLNSMLNRALHTMEIDLIMKMGFFIRDLHQNITELHAEQYKKQNRKNSFTVYRGQGLSQVDFDELKETQGGLMLFNNFILTSLDRATSLATAESSQENPDYVGVVFEITINLSTSCTSFVNIRDVSYFQNEQKMLLTMHSAFRIGQIKQIEGDTDRLWQVNLTLTNSNNNLQLNHLTEHIRKEIDPNHKGWYQLGYLMIKLGKFDKAQQVFDIMLEQTTDINEKAKLYHALGLVSHNQGRHQEAIEFFENSIEINQQILPPIHIDLAASYNGLGSVYNSMNKYSRAVMYYEKAFQIYEKTLPSDHLDLADLYNNFGEVYNNMQEYSEALTYYEKVLEIKQKALFPSHPDLATCHSNIGLLHNTMGEYSKALFSHKKALEIRQKSLVQNHPNLAISYKNIGEVYYNMQEYSEALIHYEKALEIEQKEFTPYHASLADTFNSIAGVYDELDEHLKALTNYEKALYIFHEILPPNHPSFAISYNNIAGLYDAMEDYLQALLYYKKALDISYKTFPSNHPYFAPLYGHIGMVYVRIGDQITALEYYERALELSELSLPSNHPHLKLYKESIEYIKKNL
ncbi:unnamed protein product [Adineta steineri]|uniref:Uncharacterized protein n=1 Tax=Adineta steineri TaxID=433720 RepID=A0A814GF42_9BILA|nr:unnamed protein product [Adineta steineri]CAF1065408.1 unnamed protein product [Adineta steineri]